MYRAENIAATLKEYERALKECGTDELAAAELRQHLREIRPQIAQSLNDFTGKPYQLVKDAIALLDKLVTV